MKHKVKRLTLTTRTLVGGRVTLEKVSLSSVLRPLSSRAQQQRAVPTDKTFHEQVPDGSVQDEASASFSPHFQRKERISQEWAELQPEMNKAFIEGHAPHSDANCSMCEDASATVMCLDCGPFAKFCVACSGTFHRSLLHKPKIWNKGMLEPDESMRYLGQDHCCPTTYMKTLEVFDAKAQAEEETENLLSGDMVGLEPETKRRKMFISLKKAKKADSGGTSQWNSGHQTSSSKEKKSLSSIK